MSPKNLAEEHWKWIKELLHLLGITHVNTDVVAYLYTTAMIHGYKHALEGEEEEDG